MNDLKPSLGLIIYSGTFDIFHNGHQKLAQYVIDNKEKIAGGGAEVLFLVNDPGHKKPWLDSKTRLSMVKRAMGQQGGYVKVDYFKDGGIVYMNNYFKTVFPNRVLYFVGTSDVARAISVGASKEKIKDLNFVVCNRGDFEDMTGDEMIKLGYKTFAIIPEIFPSLSSSAIKKMLLSSPETVRSLVPNEVYSILINSKKYKKLKGSITTV